METFGTRCVAGSGKTVTACRADPPCRSVVGPSAKSISRENTLAERLNPQERHARPRDWRRLSVRSGRNVPASVGPRSATSEHIGKLFVEADTTNLITNLCVEGSLFEQRVCARARQPVGGRPQPRPSHSRRCFHSRRWRPPASSSTIGKTPGKALDQPLEVVSAVPASSIPIETTHLMLCDCKTRCQRRQRADIRARLAFRRGVQLSAVHDAVDLDLYLLEAGYRIFFSSRWPRKTVALKDLSFGEDWGVNSRLRTNFSG